MAQLRNVAPTFRDFSLEEEQWMLLEQVMMEAPAKAPTDATLPGNGFVPVGLQPIVVEDSSDSEPDEDTEMGNDADADADAEGENEDEGTDENGDTEMVDAPSIDLTTDSDDE
jgi:hypothetical protein